jgi:UDP-4-amino-4,6-dideoxy-N-acetyl-beta-L-altrosamine transaminase
MIPYGRQNVTQEDIENVIQVLQSDFLTQGPSVLKFEEAFASYVGAKYAIAVSNGTAALHLSAICLGVNGKSKVITTPITFAATANCIRYCDGEVYFADINKDTYLLDIDKVKSLLEKYPKGYFDGIIPVDFAGRAVDMEAYRQLADEYGCWIIEDACHAPGGYFQDSFGNKQLCGNNNFADLAIFSFHPVKHIACGEGGMITTNNPIHYEQLLKLRSHGITKDTDKMTRNDGGWYYEMQELGFNYRMTDFQAVLGLSQLSRADEGLVRRKEIAKRYTEAFNQNQFILRHSEYVDGHAYHLFIIEVHNRKELYDYLKSKQIFCQVHYIPIYQLPYYRSLSSENIYLEESENYYRNCLSLPMYPTLTFEEQEYVINSIFSFYNE